MTPEPETYRFPQGLRPGQRHSGSFQPGNDARRSHPLRRLPDGNTLASLCRKLTPEAVTVLRSVLDGTMPDVRVADRIRAAEIVMDRAWGKATQIVQLEPSAATIVGFTTKQLEAMLAEALNPPIEGEFTGSLTVQPDGEDVS